MSNFWPCFNKRGLFEAKNPRPRQNPPGYQQNWGLYGQTLITNKINLKYPAI